jgi:hypothetical protein
MPWAHCKRRWREFARGAAGESRKRDLCGGRRVRHAHLERVHVPHQRLQRSRVHAGLQPPFEKLEDSPFKILVRMKVLAACGNVPHSRRPHHSPGPALERGARGVAGRAESESDDVAGMTQQQVVCGVLGADVACMHRRTAPRRQPRLWKVHATMGPAEGPGISPARNVLGGDLACCCANVRTPFDWPRTVLARLVHRPRIPPHRGFPELRVFPLVQCFGPAPVCSAQRLDSLCCTERCGKSWLERLDFPHDYAALAQVRGSGIGTGFFRDGHCSTGPEDAGRHTVCIEV